MADRARGRTWLQVAGAVAVLVMAGTVPAAAGPPPSPAPDRMTAPGSPGTEDPIPVRRGWSLTWEDTFDGPAGAPPDPAVWGYDLGDGTQVGIPGWGNGERQWYTDAPENVALDGDGHLVITARRAEERLDCHYGPCEYTSARILTRDRFSFQHGWLEARIQVPRGFGLWPAFWLLGEDIDEVGWPSSGEIDVMEHVGRRPTEILGTLHGPGYSGSGGISGRIDLGAPVADDFHVVAIEWEPDRIAWYVDGVRYHEVSRADVEPEAWVFEQPFFLLLNVAVGGSLGGPVFPDTEFPARMLVDHVRLYQANP
jgi:beta-glucanase (GH16 family)